MNTLDSTSPSRSALVGWKPLIGLPLLVGVIYFSGINNTYCGWDDTYFIPDNPALRAPGGLITIWAPNADPIRKFYPLTYTLYWLGFQLWGTHALGYLALNVGLHAAGAVLVFTLARRLGASAPAAWLAGGIFAAHPMHVVSVAWLASTKNVLSTTLVLGALNAFIVFRRTDRARWYVAFVGLMVAALLSKTAVISATLSVLLLDWLVLGRRGWRSCALVAPVLMVAAVLAAITAAEEWGSETSKLYAEPLALRPLAAAWAIWFYLRQFIFPMDLRVLYPRWEVAPTIEWHLPLAALALAGAALLWQRRRVGGVAIWCLAHVLLTLGPVIGLLEFGYLYHAPVSDHFIYLGSVSLAILAGLLVDGAVARFPSLQALVPPVVAGVVLLLGGLTFQRVPVYRDGVTFWTRAVADSPRSIYARDALARRLNLTERFEPAVTHWQWLLQQEPDNAEFRTNYGVALAGLSRQAEAMREFEAAARADPNAYDARLNIGNLLIQRGRPAEALAHLSEAARADPSRWEAHALLAEAESRLGNLPAAIDHTRRAAELRPDDPEVQLTLALACRAAGRMAEAIEACRAALRVSPGYAPAESRLAWLLATSPDASRRDPDEALRLAENAVSRSGGRNAEHLLALAAAQAAKGDFPEAERTAASALEIALRERGAERARIERALAQIRRKQAVTDP